MYFRSWYFSNILDLFFQICEVLLCQFYGHSIQFQLGKRMIFVYLLVIQHLKFMRSLSKLLRCSDSVFFRYNNIIENNCVIGMPCRICSIFPCQITGADAIPNLNRLQFRKCISDSEISILQQKFNEQLNRVGSHHISGLSMVMVL